MTPIEKANELYSKYDDLLNKDFGNPIVFDNQLKQCASIAIDELLNNFLSNRTTEYGRERYHFWQQVKQEIENL